MIELKQNWLKILVFIVLLISCLFLIMVQVNSGTTATKLESTLLNLIQFFLSIGFSWLLSKVVFESTYKDTQKKLAVAAFRRIKEIERNIERTQGYVSSAKKDNSKSSECLEVVDFSLINARDTIRSSISDWEDIIGEELDIAEKIEGLVIEQHNSVNRDNDKPLSQSKFEEIEKEIAELKSKLPATMRRSLSKEDRAKRKSDAVATLGKVMLENDFLDLRGFWSADGEFMSNLNNLQVGDKVYIAKGMARTRIGALMAYDQHQNTIGVITNRSGGSYDDFSYAMTTVFGRELMPQAFGGEPINAVISSISEYNTENERHHFEVKIDRKLRNKVINKNPELIKYEKALKSDS